MPHPTRPILIRPREHHTATPMVSQHNPASLGSQLRHRHISPALVSRAKIESTKLSALASQYDRRCHDSSATLFMYATYGYSSEIRPMMSLFQGNIL